MALGSTQPLTEMSTRNIFLEGKDGRCVRLTTLPPSCAVVTKSGSLNFLEPSGSVQACNGTDLPLTLPFTCCIFCISWIIKCLIIIEARCKHENGTDTLCRNCAWSNYPPTQPNMAEQRIPPSAAMETRQLSRPFFNLGGLSASRPDRFTCEKGTEYSRLGEPLDRSGRVSKTSPSRNGGQSSR